MTDKTKLKAIEKAKQRYNDIWKAAADDVFSTTADREKAATACFRAVFWAFTDDQAAKLNPPKKD